MTQAKKLLVLAVDAANPALLKEWAADGTLPNIAGMMATGLVGDTRSLDAFYVTATWPSFYTAVSPARHGFYGLEPIEDGSYRPRTATPNDLARCKALWEVLSDAGRRVVVLDVPLSRLSPDLNGTQVVEWRTHDVIFGMQTNPASLKARILATTGQHPAPAPCDFHRHSLAEYEQFTDQLARGATARARLTCELLAEAPWDFAIQVFNEMHCAGHQMWHFHDPAHPAFDHGATDPEGNLLRQVYRAVDSAIGEILQQTSPETTVVLMSLHGMSHYAGWSRLLAEMLTRLGATTPLSHDVPTGPMSIRHRMKYLLRAAYHRIPESIRRPVFELRAQFNRKVFDRGTPVPIDPLRTKCFHFDMGTLVGGIRLNIRGREPSGILAAGAEADAFCAELTAQLQEFVDPDTGLPIVRRVLRTADVYPGPHADILPDLLVEWETEKVLGSIGVGNGAGAAIRAFSPRTGLLEMVNENCRSGDHRVDGLFVARGPGIAPGELGRVTSILDLAPTFTALLGSEMPDVDGTVIRELAGH